MFKTMPALNLGTNLPISENIKVLCTKRDFLRIESALDCFAATMTINGPLVGISKLKLSVIGQITREKYPTLPLSGNIGFWPGFDHHKIQANSTKFTKFLKTLQPHLTKTAYEISPAVPSLMNTVIQNVGTRAILIRQYDLPFTLTSHQKISAQSWIQDNFTALDIETKLLPSA